MNSYAEKTTEQPKAIANKASKSSLVNNRPEALAMQSLQHSAGGSPQVQQLKAYQSMADQATVQRKIKVAKEEYTMYGFEVPESLYKALLTKECLPTAQVIDILSRYDFQNRSFADLNKLIESIKEDIKQEGVSQPQLSSQQMLKAIVNPKDPMDVEVILARGLHSIQQRDNIISNRSAGGESMDVNAIPPSEKSTLNQVETEVVPWAVKDTSVLHKSDLAEFTTNYGIANGFGKSRGGTLVIKISAKYLREGSTSESGWVAQKNAPIKIIAYIPKGK